MPDPIEMRDGDAVGMPEDAGEDAAATPSPAPQFGGISPQEAARIRWDRERARKAAESQRDEADQAVLDAEAATWREKVGIALAKTAQADIDRMVQRMVRQAGQGEERSVHAVARLATEAFGRVGQAAPVEEGEETWEGMSREKKAALSARLLREAEEMEANARSTDPGTPRASGAPSRVTPGGPPQSEGTP